MIHGNSSVSSGGIPMLCVGGFDKLDARNLIKFEEKRNTKQDKN
jgi:hypothetical protein